MSNQSTTTTTSKRTTSKRAPRPVADAAVAASTDRSEDESADAYVNRRLAVGTADAIAAAARAAVADDDAAVGNSFVDRVRRSYNVGRIMVADVALRLGRPVADFDDVSKTLGVASTNRETYLGRRYSTLRECYRVAQRHTDELREQYSAAHSAALGRNVDSLRDYVKFLDARDRSKTYSADAIVKRATSATSAADAAVAAAEARRERGKVLKVAGKVDGVKLTSADWQAMTLAQLDDVAILAAQLASQRRKDAAAAKREADASQTASETGPAPKRAARTTVKS